MTDPLDIVNDFFKVPDLETPNWPARTPFDDYWGKKVCALAERCAKAENNLKKAKEKLKVLKCYDATPDAIDMAKSHLETAISLLRKK